MAQSSAAWVANAVVMVKATELLVKLFAVENSDFVWLRGSKDGTVSCHFFQIIFNFFRVGKIKKNFAICGAAITVKFKKTSRLLKKWEKKELLLYENPQFILIYNAQQVHRFTVEAEGYHIRGKFRCTFYCEGRVLHALWLRRHWSVQTKFGMAQNPEAIKRISFELCLPL